MLAHGEHPEYWKVTSSRKVHVKLTLLFLCSFAALVAFAPKPVLASASEYPVKTVYCVTDGIGSNHAPAYLYFYQDGRLVMENRVYLQLPDATYQSKDGCTIGYTKNFSHKFDCLGDHWVGICHIED